MTTNRKLPVPLADGLLVEAVFYPSGTLCLSSQAGCAVGCPFCASGAHGLLRNLTVDELWLQWSVALAAGCTPRRLTVSGIGEPLHNAAAVAALIRAGERQGVPVSLTTSGGPAARLQEFLPLPHNGLTLSLHSARAATRRRLLPKAPDPALLHAALVAGWRSLSGRGRRKIGINYLLLDDVNDGAEELAALLEWLHPFSEATLHLLDPSHGSRGGFRPSRVKEAWYAELLARHGRVRRGNRWRTAQEGGCGTLFARHVATGE